MNTSPTVIYGINNEIISWSSTASPCLAVTNGGTFGKDTVFETGTLATPTKDGAIFEGWYTKDGTGDDRGEKVTVPSAGQTYYAKWIDLGFSDVSLQYQGTQTFAAPDGVTFSNWQSEDSGIARVVDGTITAVNVGETTITATATCNGNAAEVSIPVKVTPRVLTYTLAGGDTGSGSITYNYSGGHHALADSLTFKWKDDPNTVVELEEGTDINYTYTVPKTDETPDGGTALTYDYLPMPVGNYDNVKFNLLNENYTFGLSGGGTHDYLEIDVHVVAQGSQRAYLASAAPKADQNFVYTGQGVLPVEGTLNAYADNSTNSDPVDIGTFTVNIEGLNDTSFHSEVSGISTGTDLSSISGLTLPTKPGTYIITASAEGNGYYLYKSLVFTINKATVTVKADDQLVYVGDEMPQFTYTVSGLVGTDTLNGTVSFACDATDTDEAGTYPITPSGANVPNTELYNDDIEYETGTLTIRKGSSSGGASHPEAGSTSSSSSSDRYEISKPSNVENGSIKISNSKAEKGDTITITVTPDEGYELDELAVYDEDGDEIDLEDAGDGKYTFEMPEGEVEIEASFVAIVEAPEADFDDVPVDAWYAEAVQYVFANNLMTGVSENSFAPNAQMNRAMVAQILFNMEQPSDTEAPAAFRDVDSDAWYAEAVNWAVWQGYMSGYGTGSFGPNDALTREQLVTVLWRYSGSPVTGDPAMLNTFSDAALTSDYAQQAMIWAYDQGVIGGNADGTLNPRGTATRAEIAQILMNYCENVK
ncbi:S-layer homology domain-containing protein [Butyricicoccus pullicaecorum]|nr:S-layer homology domain-containing protein [Butyricicoccus pullicaecorum]